MGNPGSSDTTLYHWVKSVYEACGHKMPTKPNEVALLGVREVQMRQLPMVLRNYLEFSALGRQASILSAATAYDDLLFRVTVPDPSTNRKSILLEQPYSDVEIFKCTIDAGMKDASATRIPLLCEGQLYHVAPGGHNTDKYNKKKSFPNLGTGIDKRSINALHIYTGKYGQIQLARIKDKKRIFESVEDIFPTNDFSFCGLESNNTVHIHFTLKEQDEFVGGWSTGCTVLRDADLKSAKYESLLTACVKAGNSQEIPYLVMSSKYLKLFDSSYQGSSPNPFFNQKTEVIVTKNLTESGFRISDNNNKVLQTGYTPSFATRAFFDRVSRLSDELQAVANAIKAGKDNASIAKMVSANHQKLLQIKALITKKSLGAKEAATAEKWSQNLANSLKRMGFYLPKQAAPGMTWNLWTPKS